MNRSNNEPSNEPLSQEDEDICKKHFYIEVDKELHQKGHTAMPLKAAAIEIRLTAVRTYIQTPSITAAAVKRATGIPQAEKYINKYDVVSIPDQPERLVFREKVGTALTDYKVVSSYEECYDVLSKVHDFGHVKRSTFHGKMELQFGKSISLWLCLQFVAVCPKCV